MKMQESLHILAAGLVVGHACISLAADHVWTSRLLNDNWSNAGAWSPSGRPAASWTAIVRNASLPPTTWPVQYSTVDEDFTVGGLRVVAGNGLTELLIPSGSSLDVLANATFQGGGIGTLAGELKVHDTLTLAGGTLSVSTGGNLYADAIALAGGVLNTTGNAHVYANALQNFGNAITINGNLGIGYDIGDDFGRHSVGAGQQLQINGVLYLGGYNAEGTLRVENGGSATIRVGDVGNGGTGDLVVDDAALQLTNTTGAFYAGLGSVGVGKVMVGNGGTLDTTDGYLGVDVGSQGTVVVNGGGSEFHATKSLYVGGNGGAARGQGTLRAENNGAVRVDQTLRVYSTGKLQVYGGYVDTHGVTIDAASSLDHRDGGLVIDGGAFKPGVGTGVYQIDGSDAASSPWVALRNGATLNLSNTLIVGDRYRGNLTIADGSVATSLNGRIGSEAATSSGGVSVYGEGSRWTNTADLEVGVRNQGALYVSFGARVENTIGKIAPVPGSTGTVTVASGGVWDNSDWVYVGGKHDAAGGVGALTVYGDVHAKGVKAWPQGTITLDNGQFVVGDDAVQVEGELKGRGRINWTTGSRTQEVVNSGTTSPGTVTEPYGMIRLESHFAPGANYRQTSSGTLKLDVAGDQPGVNCDALDLRGNFPQAYLDGTLDVYLARDFTPQLGTRYPFLFANGGVIGKFAVENLPALAAGTRLVVDYDPDRVALFATYDADFDEDGDVDGDDLVRWKTNFGLTAGALHTQGDANRDAAVDGADVLVWQRQLGLGAVSGLENATTTPEPCGAGLIIAAGLAVILRRRRH